MQIFRDNNTSAKRDGRQTRSQKKRDAHSGASIARGSRGRIVVGFVAFHLLVISLFGLPINIFPFPLLRNLVAPYMRCVGLNEQWDTFAPNPKSAELYLKAVVVTLKENTRIYSFPRMEELSFSERYRKERYRKFTESVLCNDCSGLWPDIEREVARRSIDLTDPPDRVILLKFESPVDPKTGAVGNDAQAKPTVLSERSIESGDVQ